MRAIFIQAVPEVLGSVNRPYVVVRAFDSVNHAGTETKILSVFVMKGHSIVSKAFSKSRNKSSPGMFLSLAKRITLSISRMFSPINLPLM